MRRHNERPVNLPEAIEVYLPIKRIFRAIGVAETSLNASRRYPAD